LLWRRIKRSANFLPHCGRFDQKVSTLIRGSTLPFVLMANLLYCAAVLQLCALNAKLILTITKLNYFFWDKRVYEGFYFTPKLI
jgi:hypothetical protein